jgi:hypothetical protein
MKDLTLFWTSSFQPTSIIDGRRVQLIWHRQSQSDRLSLSWIAVHEAHKHENNVECRLNKEREREKQAKRQYRIQKTIELSKEIEENNKTKQRLSKIQLCLVSGCRE